MVLGHVDFKAFCTFCVFDMVCNIYLLDLVNILYRSWKRKWEPYYIRGVWLCKGVEALGK